MANEVHRDVLPGDSHVTAMEPFKGEFGLKTSATTALGLLKVMSVAMASRKIRVQRRLLGLGATPTRELGDEYNAKTTMMIATGCRQDAADAK